MHGLYSFNFKGISLDFLTVSRVKTLYIKTVLVTKMINRESNASSIPELTGFNVSHSALTRQVFLNATFTDNMASVPHWPLKEFPDLFCCISRDRAEALLHQLQRAIDYLDAGMDSPSLFLIDDDL